MNQECPTCKQAGKPTDTENVYECGTLSYTVAVEDGKEKKANCYVIHFNGEGGILLTADKEWSFVARSYLDLQQLRIATEARMRKLESVATDAVSDMSYLQHELEDAEKGLLKRVKDKLEGTPIWQYCSSVKGLGPVAALTFLGYINVKCSSSGKIWKYAGLTPDSKLRHGTQAKFNPEFKGRDN